MGNKDKRDRKDKINEGLSFQEQLKMKSEQLNIKVDFDKISQEKKQEAKTPVNKVSQEIKIEHIENINGQYRKAHAPYNFIPLNRKVVEYKSDIAEKNDRYYKEHNTGYIELDIETITSIYTRDTFNDNEIRNNIKNSDFYSPTGKLAIPGSSMRGMIRNLVEILSFSNFGFYDNKKLHYRAVADTTTLGNNYKELMVDESDNFYPNIESGILKKEGLEYRIYPSKYIEGTQIYRINFDKKTRLIDGTTNYRLNEYTTDKIYFSPVAPALHTHYRFNKQTNKKDKPYKLKYSRLSSVSKENDQENKISGYIISSGSFDSKHMHWVINEIDSESHYLICSEQLITDYKNDKNKEEKTDLLEILSNKSEGVPCFFISDMDNDNKKEVKYFGHTGMFRLTYNYQLKDFISQNDVSKDLTDSIFGKESEFATRVFFEDCILSEEQKNQDVLIEEKRIKILGEPKPTTFQHYLNQDSDNKKNLRTYNETNTEIRGNKLYWHKSNNTNWEETEQNKNSNMEVRIKTVKSQTKFTGRIRFENLSNIELGALLQSLELPEGCFHKIGMGKPYGLGSIKITPKLYLSNRVERYKSLFNEWNSLGSEELDKSKCIKIFQDFILKQLGETNYWNIKRLKELEKMLNYKLGCELENKDINLEVRNNRKNEIITKKSTEYMIISPNEFTNRPVLPLPSNV